MALSIVPSLPDEDDASREAWGYVAEAYGRALQVRGLAQFEVDALRASLV